MYLGRKNRFTTDKTVTVLAKLAGRKPRPENEQIRSLLDQFTARLKTEVAGPRDPKNCKQFAGIITAVTSQLSDPDQKRQWLEALAQTMAGKETFLPANGKKNAKPMRDPCADAVQKLLAPPAAPAPTT